MCSLTFCIRVMSLECHHWKPAVQAAAVMLRTPSVDGQSQASQPRPPAIYGAHCWERLHHPPVTNQQHARTPRKLGFALCCHSTQPVHQVQIRPTSLYNAPKLHPGPCSSVNVRLQTDTHTHTHRRAWPQYILRRLRLTQNVAKTSVQSNLT